VATILVLTHPSDLFRQRHFMVTGLFEHWIAADHRVHVHEGATGLPDADVALLHVDTTVVPEAYRAALRRYPVVINGATGDIGKRRFSQQLVGADEAYAGAVIVKTNANAGAVPEWLHQEVERQAGRPMGPAIRPMLSRYPIFASASEVPEAMRRDPDLVVERFLPEQDERGYYMRHWVFFGRHERCNRVLGTHPVVKAADIVERVPVPVPDEIREWRRRLGFDYGKFDFVIHEGKPVLLDVNRTPTVPPVLSDALRAGNADLAKGIETFLPTWG
jgi:hypothetical protein